jgi:hypothetical protein
VNQSLSATIALVLGVLTPVGAASAQDAAGTSAAFDEVIAASRVAAYARQHGDFNAMMTAANMMLEVPFRDNDHPGAKPAYSDGGYLAEARTLAQGDLALLTQVSLVEQSEPRGVGSSVFGLGLLRVVKDVDPHGVFSVPIKAKPNEMLRVGAIGDKSARVALTLRDGKGRAVCTDPGASFSPVCQVQPGQATDFNVEVSNPGNDPARTIILSN